MSTCSICSRDGRVTIEGNVVEPTEAELMPVELCVDHYNMVKREGKKWCPNCTVNEPVEMEFDSFVGHEEYWYCMRCDTEYKYPSRE